MTPKRHGLRMHAAVRSIRERPMLVQTDPSPVPATPPSSLRPRGSSGDDARQARILAKTVYRELREGGLGERDVMAIATELLALVTGDLRSRG
jgi:hypothetical protein